jgi:hypothetical protein
LAGQKGCVGCHWLSIGWVKWLCWLSLVDYWLGKMVVLVVTGCLLAGQNGCVAEVNGLVLRDMSVGHAHLEFE